MTKHVIAALALAAGFGAAHAESAVDTAHMVSLPDGSKYVKLRVWGWGTQGGENGRPLMDSYESYNLVTCGRGMVWSVTSTDFYRGKVVEVSYAPTRIDVSEIKEDTVADLVYKAACGRDR
ncbi:hypothetical protein [Cupriavidus sp. BIS7]|uniref:hypothetical protein n=1 Tax=Cupriavidus sp. BIS7 TaxID=1217718 RepID=UPI0003627AB5|nr:hypothetical protein [Cupriavidus sp. BIS7]